MLMNQKNSERMQCMEVWGGNQGVQRSFQTVGLRIWIYSRPYGQAVRGGDIYYVSSCASGRITRMLLADVSGHGEEASQTAIALRELMRRNVNHIKQTRFVQAMNRQFGQVAEQGGFATALVSTFFAPTRNYSVCNAGHPTPLIFRVATGEWAELKGKEDLSIHQTDMPLGILDDVRYRQFDTQLQVGDMVLSFSDAVTEARDGHGCQLGQSGILDLVRELGHRVPDAMISGIVEHITHLADDNLNQDDATLLLCQATGSGPTLKNDLLALFRLTGPVVDHTKLS